MKTLLILRHGKSSWADNGMDDHDRPLKGRGKRSAKLIGETLKRLDLVPDRIVTSTAKRASETAVRVSKASGFHGALERTRDLYLSGADSYVRTLIARAEASDERVMLVGHNPDCENLVHRLSGAREPITTANLACIDFDVDAWEDVAATPGTLRFVLRPRDLE